MSTLPPLWITHESPVGPAVGNASLFFELSFSISQRVFSVLVEFSPAKFVPQLFGLLVEFSTRRSGHSSSCLLIYSCDLEAHEQD